MPINYDEIDSNEKSINNLYNPNHPDGQAYLNSAKAKLDNHLKLIEQDPYHKVHAHPSNLANTISHYYGIVERQKNFKSNKGNLTPEHLLNIHKLALSHADYHINRIRAQTMRTEGTMSKVKNIRNIFNQRISEASEFEGDQHKSDSSWALKKRGGEITARQMGANPLFHFEEPPNSRVDSLSHGEHPITRALGSRFTETVPHATRPYDTPDFKHSEITRNLPHVHEIAKVYEGKIQRAKKYIEEKSDTTKPFLRPDPKFKNVFHAQRSIDKHQRNLNKLHNDSMRAVLAHIEAGGEVPPAFKGLTPQHVANHAKMHGIDISKPFDLEHFNHKAEVYRNKFVEISPRKRSMYPVSKDQDLHDSWDIPKPAPRPPFPPMQPRVAPPQVESFIMNKSQRIRNIFESRIKEAADLRLVHIGAMGSAALARGEDPRDVAAGIKDAVRRYREGKGKAKGMALAGIHGNAPATPEPTVVGSAEKLAKPKLVGDKEANKWKAAVEKGKFRATDSTNHARAGLKSLFEALLNELKNRRESGDLSPVPRKETRPPVSPDELKIHAANIASHIEGGATGPEAVAAEMPHIKNSENWRKMMGAGSQKTTGEQLKDHYSYELALQNHAEHLATSTERQDPFHDHGHHIRLGAELGYGPTEVKKHLIHKMTELHNDHVIGMQRGEIPNTPSSEAYAARMINMRNKLSGGPKLRTP